MNSMTVNNYDSEWNNNPEHHEYCWLCRKNVPVSECFELLGEFFCKEHSNSEALEWFCFRSVNEITKELK